MIVIQKMVAERSIRPESEQVTLAAERRLFLKRRWRGVAGDGAEFGFDLESRLKHGCVFYQTPAYDYVMQQQEEEVYELKPRTAEEAALMGWRIGNLHFPVEVTAGVIRVTHDAAILQLLEREGWPFEEVRVVFNPLRVVAHAT